MFCHLCFLLLVVHGSITQTCVPDPITDLQLTANHTLQWQASTNCETTSYRVLLYLGESHEYFYQVQNTWLNVSFLPACVTYRFLVMAISNTVLSKEVHIDTTILAQPDPELTVTQFETTQQGAHSVLLEWSFDPKFEKCVELYRIVQWDGNSLPVDTYNTMLNNMVIDDLIPCTEYEFTITPIYEDQLQGGIDMKKYEAPAVQAPPPTFVNVTLGTTYADTTWTLTPYSTNPCPIDSIILDSSPHVNLTIPISDSPERPPVSVRVTPLQADKMYLLRVTVVNSGGASTPIQVAVQTLPE